MLTNETRKLIEAALQRALSAREWNSVRHAVRCLRSGDRYRPAEKGRWAIVKGAAGKLKEATAIAVVIEAAREAADIAAAMRPLISRRDNG